VRSWGGHAAPAFLLKRTPRGFHRSVYVGGVARGGGCESFLSVAGLMAVEGLARLRRSLVLPSISKGLAPPLRKGARPPRRRAP